MRPIKVPPTTSNLESEDSPHVRCVRLIDMRPRGLNARLIKRCLVSLSLFPFFFFSLLFFYEKKTVCWFARTSRALNDVWIRELRNVLIVWLRIVIRNYQGTHARFRRRDTARARKICVSIPRRVELRHFVLHRAISTVSATGPAEEQSPRIVEAWV